MYSKQIQTNLNKSKQMNKLSRGHLLDKRKREMELNQEKRALKNVQKLPDEMINEIRAYLCGAPRQIIEKEMARKRRKLYFKMLCRLDRWHFIDMLRKIDKMHLIRFMLGSVQKCPELLQKIRFYKENQTAKGKALIEKWRDGGFPEDDRQLTFIISEEIRYFIPTSSMEVRKLGIQEMNAYIHLYKSLVYITEMKR